MTPLHPDIKDRTPPANTPISKPYVCRGCGRPEMHKMCPAWGTPFYMSGKLFTAELEAEWKEVRDKAIESAKNGPCPLD